MSWIYLALAIVFEVGGTTCMKLADGFTRPLPSIGIFVFYGVSFTLLPLALRQIDISIAYAIWSGAGTAIIAFIGASYFHETLTPPKLLCLALIIVGVVGLNLQSSPH